MASDLSRDERATLEGGVLPADVMHEILLRVPAKALCRLRLICRSWRSLTSDPRFAREHLPRHPLFAARHVLWVQTHVVDMSGDIVKQIRSFEDLRFFDLSMQPDLICDAETASGRNKRACLLNPATGEINALPDGSMSAAQSTCILGHIPSTGEYKVLRIGGVIDPVQPCEVITLGGGDRKWRERSDPPIHVLTGFTFVAVVGGVAYFLADYYYYAADDTKQDSIASFDLVTEEWRPTALQGPVSTNPVDTKKVVYDPHTSYPQLAKLNGCLVMAFHSYQHCSLDLWFLIDVDRCIWNRGHSIRCPPSWGLRAPYSLVVLDDGKVVVWLKCSQVLKAYDPRIGTWADLAALENYSFFGMLEGSLLCSGLQN
ncbi:hypothetical protein PAHAL_2G432000 [Panicum hallii]|jgi:F-box interacting protein|uniref:F-box domain-containing protein n=1 Tax=Panicum hallii TaxID=206008 RepID=A0A2S3H435_9POAL|nr:hypothetical protein PAHAL_2G432000 [Panicum hallii]